MDEQQEQQSQPSGSLTYYLLGAIVLVLIVGGVYFLRPKAPASPTSSTTELMAPVASPTPGPITGLACERQWYNPVIGFAKYYLGVDGVDLMTTKKVMCNFSVSVAGNVVATTSAESTLTSAVERGGGTFRCDSAALELEPNVPTVVDVILKNDTNQTASCTQTFFLPQP